MKKIIFILLSVLLLNNSFLKAAESPEDEKVQGLPCSFLTTLKEHRDFLSDAIESAQEKIIIISPYLSKWAIEADDIISKINDAQERGVEVSIYTDCRLDEDPYSKTRDLKPAAKAARELLQKAFCDLKIVSKIHAKTLIRDETMIATGSFNWLSALRNTTSPYSNLEHTLVLDSENGFNSRQIKEFIRKACKSVEKLEEIVSPYQGFYEEIRPLLPSQVKEIPNNDTTILEWISKHGPLFPKEAYAYINTRIAGLVEEWAEEKIEEQEFVTSVKEDIYDAYLQPAIKKYIAAKYDEWLEKQK